MKLINSIHVSIVFLALTLIGLSSARGQGVLLESMRPEPIDLPRVDRRMAESTANRATIVDAEKYATLQRGTSFSGAYRRVMLYTPSVGNQGSNGACVGFAVGYAAASILAYPKYGSWNTALRSPSYVFNQIRVGLGCDSGAFISDALQLVTSQGVCSYRSMPYVVNQCHVQPNERQRDDAFRNRVMGWGTLPVHTDTLRWALSLGYPVVVSFRITQSFYDMYSNGGMWRENNRPLQGEPKYHAVCVVGFDDELRMFKVQNSWGSSGGDKGFFWVSYDLVNPDVFRYAYMFYGVTPDPKLEGALRLCSMGTYSVFGLQAGDRPEWSVSEGIEIVSGQGTASLTVRPVDGFADYGEVTVSVAGRKACSRRVEVGAIAPRLQLFEGYAARSPYGLCVGEEYRLVAYDRSGREVIPDFLPSSDMLYSLTGSAQAPASPYNGLSPSKSGIEESGVPFIPERVGYFNYACVYLDEECGESAPAYLQGSALRCGSSEEEYYLHPNPARSLVTIGLKSKGDMLASRVADHTDAERSFMVRIYSQHAELMYEGAMTDGMQLDVRGWVRGVYTVMVDGRGVQTLVVK